MKGKSFVALCTASFLLSPLGVTVAAPTTVQAATQSTPRYPGQIIQEGSTGTAVKAIQTQLNKWVTAVAPRTGFLALTPNLPWKDSRRQ